MRVIEVVSLDVNVGKFLLMSDIMLQHFRQRCVSDDVSIVILSIEARKRNTYKIPVMSNETYASSEHVYKSEFHTTI